MAFIANFEEVAAREMHAISPSLEEKFKVVIKFLAFDPASASRLRSWSGPFGTEAYIRAAAVNFASGRQPKKPVAPTTTPDEMVSFVLENYFDVDTASLARIKQEHLLSMAAENIVGDLLERYVATVLEPRGWAWCSGSLVKHVDFVRSPTDAGAWKLLQVKNRDNSENAAGSSVRIGTMIKKWHRTFSRRVGSNWAAFPEPTALPHLSEEGFHAFAKAYLKKLRA